MSIASHVAENKGKYTALGGVLAFVGQFAYHCWEHSFDEWFWDRYVHGVSEHCPMRPYSDATMTLTSPVTGR